MHDKKRSWQNNEVNAVIERSAGSTKSEHLSQLATRGHVGGGRRIQRQQVNQRTSLRIIREFSLKTNKWSLSGPTRCKNHKWLKWCPQSHKYLDNERMNIYAQPSEVSYTFRLAEEGKRWLRQTPPLTKHLQKPKTSRKRERKGQGSQVSF